MFLRSLSLKNVRSFESFSIDFGPTVSRGWTLLVGENGTGKSTVLRSIALVLSGSDAMHELLREGDSWIRNGTRRAEIHATIETSEALSRTVSLTLLRGEPISKAIARNAKGLRAIDAAMRYTKRSYLTVGYGANRQPPMGKRAELFPMRVDERAANVLTLFRPDASLNSLESWAMDLDYRTKGAGLRIVRDTLDQLLPNVKFKSIDRKQRKLIFSTPDGDVPLDQLSDGYQNMAAWCGDLVFRITQAFGDYANPFAARVLLLVDEIDLHLHPLWQRNLREFLFERFPNLQVVATTHSVLTAQQAGVGELHSLIRTGKRINEVPFAGNPRLMMAHQLMLDPLFEVGTLDSALVEGWKAEYRVLSKKPRKTKVEANKLKLLSDRLADLPEWNDYSGEQRRKTALLREIKSELTRRQAASPSKKASSRRSR